MSLYKDLGISTGEYKPPEIDKRFVMCRRKGSLLIRPLEPGESLPGVSIPTGVQPEPGDFVAQDKDGAQWLLGQAFVRRNYRLPEGW